MKSITKKLSSIVFTAALLLGNVTIAAENESTDLKGDLLKQKVDKQILNVKKHDMLEVAHDILDENVRKHRDSSLYKSILVNDKIQGRYENLNYKINKFFKYELYEGSGSDKGQDDLMLD